MCPELMYGGVHDDDALKVFKKLCIAVEGVIQIFKEDGKPLPAPKEVIFETV